MEEKRNIRKERRKRKQEEEPRERSTRRGFCSVAATFRRRHIHSDTLLVILPFLASGKKKRLQSGGTRARGR